MLRRIRERLAYVRQYHRALRLTTPICNGREALRVGAALKYDPASLGALPSAVQFEPRNTFAQRAVEWARGR